MIADLTYESFEPHLETGFAISSEGYDDVLTLVDLRRGQPNPRGGREAFTLKLRGARSDVMYNSMMFTLSHPVMGEMALFINPVGKNDDGTFNYEVPFN